MPSSRTTPPLQRWTAGVQGVFYLITGVWPLLHMASFLAVTGPKTDLWLVRTVGVLIAVIGATLLMAFLRNDVPPEVRLLAMGSAIALAAVDVIYVSVDRISAVYLLDAVAEGLLVAAWAEGERRRRKPPGGK